MNIHSFENPLRYAIYGGMIVFFIERLWRYDCLAQTITSECVCITTGSAAWVLISLKQNLG